MSQESVLGEEVVHEEEASRSKVKIGPIGRKEEIGLRSSLSSSSK